MSIFRIKIADCVILIDSLYSQCQDFCRDFLTEDEPNFSIVSTQGDIDSERASYEAINGKYGSDGIIEIQVISRKISEKIVDFGAFMMHGAAISVNNYAYIFTGHSGIGKTTHILKWLMNVPNAQEINGDKPFIIPGKMPMACSSPWAGKEKMYRNSVFPLKAIVLLQRAEDNEIKKVPLIDVFPELCQQIVRTDDIERTRKTLQMLKSLEPTVSFYRFNINNFKDDCFDVAYNALVGKQK